jgi:hypothetical protein
MKKTTQIAADRTYDETKTVLPAEMARGVYMHHAPSLRALKLMHLMIAKAGGRMAEPVQHEMRLSEINSIDGMAHYDQESIKPLFLELTTAAMVYDEPEKKRYSMGTLLDKAVVDYRHEVTGDILVSWYFGRLFLEMAERSNHWAILDRQTVFHLQSKYSVLLFQYFASLQNLKHKTGEIFTVDQLRSMLGIEGGKITRFSTLNQRVLQPAIAEINQLSRFTLTATLRKTGRTVTSVEISWEPKPDPTKIKRELAASKVGRKARLNGGNEMIVSPFPASGGLSTAAQIDQHWRSLFEESVNRIQGNHLPDSKLVCDAFRKVRGDKLDATDTERHFVNFCKQWRG